jgi:hypothetical protein
LKLKVNIKGPCFYLVTCFFLSLLSKCSVFDNITYWLHMEGHVYTRKRGIFSTPFLGGGRVSGNIFHLFQNQMQLCKMATRVLSGRLFRVFGVPILKVMREHMLVLPILKCMPTNLSILNYKSWKCYNNIFWSHNCFWCWILTLKNIY